MKAFPDGMTTDDRGVVISSQPGMDLRDYFAAQALLHAKHLLLPDDIAKRAYQMADEMMKAREST